jgi:hypothetical protein
MRQDLPGVKDPSRTPGSASRVRKEPSPACSGGVDIWADTCLGCSQVAGAQKARSGMNAVAIVIALATFALMFGLIRAMDRI